VARAEGHCGSHTVTQHQLCKVGFLSVRLCVDKTVCRAADGVAPWHETSGRGHVIQDVMVHCLSCKAEHDHQYHHIHIYYMDVTISIYFEMQDLPYLMLAISIATSSNVYMLIYASGMLNLLLQVA